MSAGPDAKPISIARKIWLYGSIVFLIAVLYVGWTLFSRWQENRDLAQKAAAAEARKERTEAARTVETLGGNQFAILSFYVSPGTVRRGETAQLCYGVSNAKTVRIDPPVASVWPSYTRCFDVTPAKTTTYTLTADDVSGNTKTSTLTLTVR